jgi:predicted PurR-regulated permease PerM
MLETAGLARSDAEVFKLVKGVAAALLTALIVAALYFGRDVFVPIALAVLLSFVLAPVVRRLEGWRVPRGGAVIGVAAFAFLTIFAVGGVIATQVAQLASELPSYEANMRSKIQSFRGTAATTSTLERAADVLQDLGKELNKPKDKPAGTAPPSATPGADAKPIPVEVRQPPPTALESIAALISPLLHPLATTGIVIIFVIFTLMQREELRNRLIKLAGTHDLQKTTGALDDAARRLSRFFLAQLALNAGIGLLVGVALWLIGIPSAVLWGILAAILRFVPYIGTFISAIFPLALAVAIDPGWMTLLWTASVFFILEPIAGHLFEPLLYGKSTGLSPLAVVLSATFWTTLWGPIGLVLSTPLTVCLVVLGRHVDSLKFIDVMFGNRPALSPPEVFYQRMLADDPAEVIDKAEEYLEERSLTSYYDDVALKGLKLAQTDLDRGLLDAANLAKIRNAVTELVDEFEDHEDRQPEPKTPAKGDKTVETDAADGMQDAAIRRPELPVLNSDQLAPAFRSEHPVLCVGGRTDLDGAVAMIFAQLLSKHGIVARAEDADVLSTASTARLDTTGVALACVSFLDSSSPAHIRYTIRRLRRRLPDVPIVLACWMSDVDAGETAEAVKADAVVTTLHEGLEVCLKRAGRSPATKAAEDGPPAVKLKGRSSEAERV